MKLELNNQEVVAVVDALKKGQSRHESYARFKPKHSKQSKAVRLKHENMAMIMRQVRARLEAAEGEGYGPYDN